MKKILKEDIFFKLDYGIEKLFNQISEFQNVKKRIIKICNHDTKNGKTIILILNCGMIEIHEILSKNKIYMALSFREKKEFEKIKKELENLNVG